MSRARVHTFHIDSNEVLGLTEALDGVADMFAHRSDFRGLLCLTHDSVRKEIVVITLWDGEGPEETLNRPGFPGDSVVCEGTASHAAL